MSISRRRMIGGKVKIPNYLCFTALEDGTFTLTLGSSLSTTYYSYIEYSIDGGATWTKTNNVNNQTRTITTPTIQAGNSVLWRGSGRANSQYGSDADQYNGRFSSSGKFNVSGCLNSYLFLKALDSTNLYNNAFFALFKNCTNIVDASELILPNATSNNCYYLTFCGCSNLISMPELPATTLADSCYYQMFISCSSLKNVYNIPAKNLVNSCFREMFRGCTALEEAPSFIVDSATGSNDMYGMFYGCTALTDASGIVINGFTGTSVCQNMFRGCSNLVDKVPTINATTTTTKCFSYMFYQCSKLTTSPTLPASITSQECYSFMFHSTKLNYIKMYATDVSASDALKNWMYGAPNVSTSIFVKHIDAIWTTTGDSGVPNKWKIIYYDPAVDKYYTDQTRATECDDHGNPI